MHFSRWKLYVIFIKVLVQLQFNSVKKNLKYNLKMQNTRIALEKNIFKLVKVIFNEDIIDI